MLSVVWLLVYSIFLFPVLPLFIGGGQPRSMSLLANDENIKILNSLNISLATGGTHQTENVCVAYESAENIIIMRPDRVLSLKKSLIDGFGSLPGKRAEFEQECVRFASTWAKQGSFFGIIQNLLALYNLFLAGHFGLPDNAEMKLPF